MKKFATKKFWLRVLCFFVFYLPLYFLISFISDEKEAFLSVARLSKAIGSSFFMALFFAYFFQSKTEHSLEDDEIIVHNPTIKSFFTAYFILLIIGLIILNILLFIGWIIIQFFGATDEPFLQIFLKANAVAAVMCLLINCFFFFSEKWKYKQWKRKKPAH